MKFKKELKIFLDNNHTMINSLMCDEERKIFHDKDPVYLLLDEINRQIAMGAEKNK